MSSIEQLAVTVAQRLPMFATWFSACDFVARAHDGNLGCYVVGEAATMAIRLRQRLSIGSNGMCEDQVICLQEGVFLAIVNGQVVGRWRSISAAKAGLEVEQRRANKRLKEERYGN